MLRNSLNAFAFSAAMAVITLVSSPAVAQSVKSEITASNGVVVTVYSDEFANRYEYTAPAINHGDGFALVAKIVRAEATTDTHITGTMMYRGDWRRYTSALFRGGVEAPFVERGREVGSCSGSRYGGGCSLRESYNINITPEQIRTHGANGTVDIQVRAQDTTTTLLSIPTSYFDAVNEVAGQRSAQ